MLKFGLCPALVVSGILMSQFPATAQTQERVPATPSSSATGGRAEDAAVEVSRKAAERLARTEEQAGRAVKAFVAAANKVDLKKLETLDITVETGLKACEIMREQLKDLADRSVEYLKNLEALREDLARAPGVQRQLAVYYREKADKVTGPVVKQQYLRLAENCDNLIPRLAERLKNLDSDTSRAKHLPTMLREQEEFFADAAAFFRAYPGSLTLEDRRQFREDLKDVAEKVNAMLEALEAFNKNLKAEAVSSALRAERETEFAAAESLKHSPANSLAVAKALTTEVNGISRQVQLEYPKIAQSVAMLRSQGRRTEAEKVWTGWVGLWQGIDARYERPALTAVSATRGIANHRLLVLEGYYPLGRQNYFLAGYVRVIGRHSSGGYEIVAVEGQIQPGDFILVKVA